MDVDYDGKKSITVDGSANGGLHFIRQNVINLFNQLKSIGFDFLAYPDAQKEWIAPALASANSLMEMNEFDAIISTSPPASSHLIANKLADRHNCGWIADYRDLWTQDHYNDHTLIRRVFEDRLESKTVQKSDFLTSTTPPFANLLEKYHDKKAFCIYNGYDEEEKIHTKLDDNFSITYTGSLYNGKRNPEPLFKAITKMMAQDALRRTDIKLNFIGNHGPWLQDIIYEYEMNDLVNTPGRLKREKVLEFQNTSQILLSIQWDHPKERRVCPGKIFEYLAAGRPILAYGGPAEDNDTVSSILTKTSAGVKVSHKQEMQQYLLSKYREYRDGGAVPYCGNTKEIKKFTHEKMAREFSNVLNQTYA
jgi:glycosyltransferase involved in cell wall biosynthesis